MTKPITAVELAERLAYENGTMTQRAIEAMQADPRPARQQNINVESVAMLAFDTHADLGTKPCFHHTCYGTLPRESWRNDDDD